jgi:hypothetical protein
VTVTKSTDSDPGVTLSNMEFSRDGSTWQTMNAATYIVASGNSYYRFTIDNPGGATLLKKIIKLPSTVLVSKTSAVTHSILQQSTANTSTADYTVEFFAKEP